MRIISFSHNNIDFTKLRVPDPLGIQATLECNIPLKEMHCETPLSLLSLAVVITACVSVICYTCQSIVYDDSSGNNNINDATLECTLLPIDAKLELEQCVFKVSTVVTS